jgi:DNA-binding MarR family transcriptional regulator
MTKLKVASDRKPDLEVKVLRLAAFYPDGGRPGEMAAAINTDTESVRRALESLKVQGLVDRVDGAGLGYWYATDKGRERDDGNKRRRGR